MQTNTKPKIHSFTDLKAWQQAHQLALAIHQISKTFPKDERFSLVDQIRRSALSVSSNIAEGFGRQGKKEKVQFYYAAKASLTELQNQLLYARDVGYCQRADFDMLATQTILVSKLLSGLIRSIKRS